MTPPIEVQALTVLVASLSTVSMEDFDIDVLAFPRALDRTDPHGAIGVYFHSWTPVEGPNIGMNEPTLGRYRYAIQAFIKASVRAEGEEQAATLAKRIRNHLYRDANLRTVLASLREDGEPFPIERAGRYGVQNTEYADVPFAGGFAFLSQTEFYLETEVIA